MLPNSGSWSSEHGMALDVDDVRRHEPELSPEFLARLETSLEHADQERRRHLLLLRLRKLMPLVLLIGPVIGWRLILASPDGVKIGVNALAWITFVLDIGVHLNTALLSYLHLQALPTLVGLLLFVVVTTTVLWTSKGPE